MKSSSLRRWSTTERNKRKLSSYRLKLQQIFELYKNFRLKKSRKALQNQFQKVKSRFWLRLKNKVRHRKVNRFGMVSKVSLKKQKANWKRRWRQSLTKQTVLSTSKSSNSYLLNNPPNSNKRPRCSRIRHKSSSRFKTLMRWTKMKS